MLCDKSVIREPSLSERVQSLCQSRSLTCVTNTVYRCTNISISCAHTKGPFTTFNKVYGNNCHDYDRAFCLICKSLVFEKWTPDKIYQGMCLIYNSRTWFYYTCSDCDEKDLYLCSTSLTSNFQCYETCLSRLCNTWLSFMNDKNTLCKDIVIVIMTHLVKLQCRCFNYWYLKKNKPLI